MNDTSKNSASFNPPKMDATIITTLSVSRRDRDVRPHFLERIDAADRERFKLNRPEMTVGRGEDADVVVPSQRASRHHAILSRRGADYFIRDNDSRNGVFLNGLKIHSAVLRDGDVIQIGESQYIYHDG